jgi:hypothetical protein
MIPLNPVITKSSPRLFFAEMFKSLDGELPIRGGWGYSKSDACIIDRFDPTVDPNALFDGVGIEQVFVERRIYAEMIVCRPEGEKFAGIEWSQLTQEQLDEGSRQFHKLTVEIRSFPEKEWEDLKAEYDGPTGSASPGFNHEAHEKKRQKKTVFVTREFWFDISSFVGENLTDTNHETTRSEQRAAASGHGTTRQDVVTQRKWWQFWQ